MEEYNQIDFQSNKPNDLIRIGQDISQENHEIHIVKNAKKNKKLFKQLVNVPYNFGGD